jgi:hypothetical protein
MSKSPRFNVKGLASQRRRLRLPATSVGIRVGASGQSVYNWEADKARHRASYLAALAALHGLSKTHAAEIPASRKVAK